MAATIPPPRILPSGDSAITVEFSRNIDDAANQRVLALDRALAGEPVAGVTETVPTYRSLLVHYDPLRSILVRWVRSLSRSRNALFRRRQKPGAGGSPLCMAASMASTLRASPKHSRPPRKISWRGTSPATIGLP